MSVDVLAAIPMRASNLMPVHIKQTLNTLGKLSGAAADQSITGSVPFGLF